MVSRISSYPGHLGYQGVGLARPHAGGGFTSLAPYPSQQNDETSAAYSPWELLTSNELDPLVIMFFGRRGEGKTLTMTAMGSIMMQAYAAQGQKFSRRHPYGFRLASNYHVKFADFNNPMLVDLLVKFPPWAHHILCMVDEILAYFPSRRTMARGNLDFGTFLQQIRKRDIEMICTTQFPQNLDGQMLQQINLFVMPILYNRKNSVRLLIWDWWGQYTGRIWHKHWPPIEEPPDYKLSIHGLHGIFPWFESKEVVAPMWSGAREEIIEQNWKNELDQMEASAAAAEQEQHVLIGGAQQAPKTLKELAESCEDDFYIATILDDAKGLDRNIKAVGDLAEYLSSAGFMVHKEGRYGYRARRV